MSKMRSRPDRLVKLMSDVSSFHASKYLLDTVFITKDGKVWAHSPVVGAVSPYVKSLCNSVDDGFEEPFTIFLPDVRSLDLEILFHLIYTGSAFIYKSELNNVKALSGMLKIITISVTMNKQEWDSRRHIGEVRENVSLSLVREESLPRSSPSEKGLQNADAKSSLSFPSSTLDSDNDFKKLNSNQSDKALTSTTTKPHSFVTSDIHLMRFTSSDLDRLTMSELANKDLNPLFEEATSNNPVVTTSNLAEEMAVNLDVNREETDNLASPEEPDMEQDHGMSEVKSTGDESLASEMLEDLETVKQFEVYVSGSGEVTAMEVVGPGIDKLKDVKDKDHAEGIAKDGEKIFESVDSRKDEFMGVEAERSDIDFDIHQIASMNPDAPFVISNSEGAEGVIGLISVTEAFENSQRPDFFDVSNPVEVEGTETETLIKSCVLCDKSVLGQHALGRHMKKAHPKLFGPYECPFPDCNRAQEDGAKMLAHVTQQHDKLKQAVTTDKNEIDNRCKICKIELSSIEILSRHLSRFHGIQEGESQQEKQVFICSSCNQEFRTSRNYAQHMKQEHKEKPWLCDECGKKFDVKQNYQQHCLQHGDKKSFVCDLCSKSYSTPRLLYSHRSLHLGRRFPCNMCSFVGRSSANIRGHKINVHGERKFSCSVCGKKFAVSSNLQDHMRIHTGETPFSCEICDMSYKRKHHLACHFRSKGHKDMLKNCNKLGIKVPPDMDPDLPKPASSRRVQETILPSHTNFETHIAEIDDDDQQVLIFEPCEEIEPYIIEETEEVVVM